MRRFLPRRRSTKPPKALEFSSQRPSPAGRVPQISSRRGAEFGGADQLVRARADFLAHAFEARGAGLSGRPRITRRRPWRSRGAARCHSCRASPPWRPCRAAPCAPGISRIARSWNLERRRTPAVSMGWAQAGKSRRIMSSSGWCALAPVPARPARDATGRWARGLPGRLGGGVEARAKRAQAGVHAQAGAAHGGLEIIARVAAAGDRAEQAGADDAAGAVGQVLQVEAHSEALGGGAAGLQHLVRIGDAAVRARISPTA